MLMFAIAGLLFTRCAQRTIKFMVHRDDADKLPGKIQAKEQSSNNEKKEKQAEEEHSKDLEGVVGAEQSRLLRARPPPVPRHIFLLIPLVGGPHV
jgi:hypothetical protein